MKLFWTRWHQEYVQHLKCFHQLRRRSTFYLKLRDLVLVKGRSARTITKWGRIVEMSTWRYRVADSWKLKLRSSAEVLGTGTERWAPKLRPTMDLFTERKWDTRTEIRFRLNYGWAEATAIPKIRQQSHSRPPPTCSEKPTSEFIIPYLRNIWPVDDIKISKRDSASEADNLELHDRPKMSQVSK